MAQMFYEQDCSLDYLAGKKIAIVGYGSQGHAHALNLRDSGCDVVVALYEGSKSWKKAEDAGLTVMTTADNKRIVLPNKGVWGGPIVNYSAQDTRRVDMQVGVAYGEDIAKAIDVIREAVSHVPGVLAEPAPAVAVAALDSSQVTINVRPWAKGGDYWSVYSATLQSVKDELGKAGIEIPFPQVTVHQA